MFSYIVSGNDETWERNPTAFERDRIITTSEYTVAELQEKYGILNDKTINMLIDTPCLLGYEGSSNYSRLGFINKLTVRSKQVIIEYEFDQFIQQIPNSVLLSNKYSFDIEHDFEINRTHWALKNVDLYEELLKLNLATSAQINASRDYRKSNKTRVLTNNSDIELNKVFIVHGHDELAKVNVARFVESLGLEATILHEQPNNGNTIIEKFEAHATKSAYAIVLLTPDDIGYAKDLPNTQKYRARQNVIFELGYFCGALSRKNVCVLYSQDVEIPNDYLSVVYTPMDSAGAWRFELAREMKSSGLLFDMNLVV